MWRVIEGLERHYEDSLGKTDPRKSAKNGSSEGLGRAVKTEGRGHLSGVGGGRGPNRVQNALERNEKGYGGWLKVYMGTGRSVEMKQSLKGRQHPSLGRV